MELLLTGDPMDAQRALAVGLINKVVPQQEVLACAMQMAETIAANGPVAVREIKRTVRRAFGASLEDGFGYEDEAYEVVVHSQDAREGPRAFMEKRTARFVGR